MSYGKTQDALQVASILRVGNEDVAGGGGSPQTDLEVHGSLSVTDGSSTLTVTNDSLAVAKTTGTGTVACGANSSAVIAYVNTDGSVDVTSTAEGSLTNGYVEGNGGIVNDGKGALVGGYSNGGFSSIQAGVNALGSMVRGAVTGSGTMTAYAKGSFVGGSALDGVMESSTAVSTSAIGSLVYGDVASASSTLKAGGTTNQGVAHGALVVGSVNGSGAEISAGGTTANVSRGAFVGGYASGTNSKILSTGVGSHDAAGCFVHGYTEGGSTIRCGSTFGSNSRGGRGAIMFGNAELLGEIRTGTEGAWGGAGSIIGGHVEQSAIIQAGSENSLGSYGGAGGLICGFAKSSSVMKLGGNSLRSGSGAWLGGRSDGSSTMRIGGTATGVQDIGNGAMIHGETFLGQMLIGTTGTLSGRGAHMFGYADNAIMQIGDTGASSGRGATMLGLCENGATMTIGSTGSNTGSGALVGGVANGSSSAIRAGSATSSSGMGAIVYGRAASAGILNSGGAGNSVFGYALGTGAVISGTGAGSSAVGHANTGIIQSLGSGASIFANSNSSSTMTASGAGSNVHGIGNTSATVTASGDGSAIFCHSTSGTVTAPGLAAAVIAYKSATGSNVTNSGNGSLLVCGHSVAGSVASSNSGEGTIMCGRNLANAHNYALVIGRNGDTSLMLPVGLVTGEGAIHVANGTDSTSHICARIGSAALGGAGVGVTDSWVNTASDYAEMFEWQDSNPGAVERHGYFVALYTGASENDRIVMCDDTMEPLGVTTHPRGLSSIIGDAGELEWVHRQQRDDLGVRMVEYKYRRPLEEYCLREHVNTETYEIAPAVYEEDGVTETSPAVTAERITAAFVAAMDALADTDAALFALVPDLPASVVPEKHAVINPAFDPNLAYVPRLARPEWTPVGLLGKVFVRDDGTCVPGQKCKPSATGTATHSASPTDPYRYRVLSRESANVVRIFVK